MTKKVLTAFIIPILLAPALVSAQTGIRGLIQSFGGLLDLLITILIGAALVVFFWGLVKFVFKLGGEESIDGGRRLMVWGLIALFVMVSVWGIITFFQRDILGGGDTELCHDPSNPWSGPMVPCD